VSVLEGQVRMDRATYSAEAEALRTRSDNLQTVRFLFIIRQSLIAMIGIISSQRFGGGSPGQI
jgi:hypothetical protein